MQSWNQCAISVITTMALWQLMHLSTAVHHVPKCMSGHKAIVVMGGHIVFMIAYILCSSCFCEIWALCVTWINYDHLYYIYIKLINIVIMMMMMIIIMIQSSPYGYLTLWHRIVFSLVKDTDIKEIQYVDILDTFYSVLY